MDEPTNSQTGDGGEGKTLGAGSDPTGGSADAASQDGAGGGDAGDAGKGGGEAETKMPENLEDALELIKVMSTADDEKTTSLEAEKAAHAELKGKVGKQGDVVAAFKKFEIDAKEDPKGLIAGIAKAANLTVNYGAPAEKLDLEAAIASNDPEQLKKALSIVQEQSTQAALTQLKSELGPALSVLQDEHMLKKYPDFETLTTERTLIQTDALSQKLPWNEVFHLAAQGANLPGALTAAEKKGYDAGMAAAVAKKGASHADGGAQPTTLDKSHDPNSKKALMATIDEMAKVK